MIVYSTGLDDNPETLIARAQHTVLEFVPDGYELSVLDGMYEDVFNRHDNDGNRIPYSFEEAVTNLVGLGFDVRDWTGGTVESILPFNPDKAPLVEVVFQSRLAPATSTVRIPGSQVREFVADMERSGLWFMLTCRKAGGRAPHSVSTETEASQ